MRYLPVHWSEGMFLRPHHFQAADRHWAEVVATAGQWDNPYNYGIRKIDISEEALANHQVQVSSLNVRLPDGTLFSLEVGQELDRVDLKAAFDTQSEVTIHLGIPKLVLGRANVGQPAANEQRRYTPTVLALQDEAAGGNDQEIGLLDANAKVLLSTQDAQGYETVPLARIKRTGSEEATPVIDTEYIPPLLAIDAWPPLALDIVRAIYDIVGEKIDVLSGRVTDRGVTLASTDAGDLDDLLMLMSLNEAQATLHNLAFSRGVHPFLAYRQLCDIVGRLSIFDPNRKTGEIPVYDHDDLAKVFAWVRLRIEQLLGSRKKLQYEQRYFVGTERGMQVAIEPEWLHAGWDWYVGVNGQNITDTQCRELLQPGKLDWKMGSDQQVELIFRHGLPGVEQTELSKPPRALPAHQGWIYYEIQRENNAWKDVLASQTLALRFKTELIGNLENLPGERKLEVLLDNKRAILQFALFAVPAAA